MIESHDFLKKVLDTMTEHIAVIDSRGNIIYVNEAWIRFGDENACTIANHCIGTSYLEECDKAAEMGDDVGLMVAHGIRSVIRKKQRMFYFEYPCHSTEKKRWFMMRVTFFTLHKQRYFVISHQNITQRKLAEEKALNLSKIDGLTGIANRRHFNDFLHSEWNRCTRLSLPLTLAIIDIDHFKLLNDTYGHQVGDNSLKQVATTISHFTKRPGDLCARYGGEEFAIIYGNTKCEEAFPMLEAMVEAVRNLDIPNKNAPTRPSLTMSIGLATMNPELHQQGSELIQEADQQLYYAKQNGRNQIAPSNTQH